MDKAMITQTQLEIIWDGPIPSLNEHRVSLSLFGPALNNMLTAVRRIASNMVSSALEPAETGRFAKEAHQIDVEIDAVVGSSGGVAAVLTFQSPDLQQPLFNQLTEAVGTEFLESVISESQGFIKNSAVRNYLHSLPPALTSQRYHLHDNGRTIKTVQIGAMNLARLELDLPELKQIVGRIIGVSFSPAPHEVRVTETQSARITTASSSARQVEQALELRELEVRATVLSSPVGDRLLSLEDASLPKSRADAGYFLFKKWEKALKELA